MNMLLQLQSIWDGRFDRIKIPENRVVLLQTDTAPIRSAPFQAVSKPCEFEKAENNNMLVENTIEPTQSE